MRLDQEGDPGSTAGLLARFGGTRSWFESELSFVVVVDGDLATPGHIRFSTDDYVPGLVVVTGDLRAGALFFELGARIVVEGSAVITQACLGRWGDANAMLDVHGELDVPLLALDGHTPVFAERGVRSVTSNTLGWWEPLTPDILPGDVAKSFRRDVLDDRGLRLDFERAFAAAREGSPLLAPGVAESFPQRLEARPAVSGYRLE